jgi:ankyrin repeat protein
VKLKLIYLSISFAVIHTPVSAMEAEETEEKAQALIDEELRIAIYLEDCDRVKSLVEKKNANVNSCDSNGSTPLIMTIIRGYWDIANYLLTRNDIDIDLANKQGLTPLCAAAQQCASAEYEVLRESASQLMTKLMDMGAHNSFAAIHELKGDELKKKWSELAQVLNAKK